MKKRNKNYVASEKRIVELVQSCTLENILEKLQQISDVLRMGDSFRSQTTRSVQTGEMPIVLEPSLPPLPAQLAQPSVDHPIVALGSLPTTVRRSAQLTRNQEAVANEMFQANRTILNNEEDEHEYELLDVTDGGGYDVDIGNAQHDDNDDDPGYSSGNDLLDFQQLDDGQGRSAGYSCDSCPRIFGTSRGLQIHKAAHKRKPMKSCNK